MKNLIFIFILATHSLFGRVYENGTKMEVEANEKTLNFSQKYPNLQAITFSSDLLKDYSQIFKMTDSDLGLNKNVNLRSFDIIGQVKSSNFNHILLPQVENLFIGYVSEPNEEFLIKSFPNVRHLSVYSSWNPSFFLQAATKLPKLEHIEINTQHDLNFSEKDLIFFTLIPNLRTLKVSISGDRSIPDTSILETLQQLLPDLKIEVDAYIRGGYDYF